MAQDLVRGDLFKSEGVVYLVINARYHRTYHTDDKPVTGWLVSAQPFKSTDQHGFAEFDSKSQRDSFQRTTSGESDNMFREVEILPDKYVWTAGRYKKLDQV